MKLISHRGNLNGKFESYENEPNYIDIAIKNGYDVEVDVWVLPEHKNLIFLGHDKPQYGVTINFFIERIKKLWVHCKNIESLVYFQNSEHPIHFFWHQEDDVTLTSLNYIWAYPGKQPTKGSIAVMPEINNDDVTKCIGICSDYITNY